jgi:protein TonB
MLIHRVEPLYPPVARQTRIQGTVQLHAVIARDGSIASLEALSGHPLLIRAALDAVRQWRYRATLLGSEPVEVETYITVIFKLGDN